MKKERFTKLSYSLSGAGKEISYGLTSSYLMYFYTEMFGISVIAAGTLFLVARIWDAINDPLMGVIMEKTNSKRGKVKPYVLLSSIAVFVFTVLAFLAPDVKNKLLYAYITYIGWGMSFTVLAIANTSAASLMTRDDSKRTSLITWHRLGTLIGNTLPLIAVIPVVQAFGGGLTGFRSMGILFGVIGLVLCIQFYFFFNENVTERKVESHESLKRDKKSITKNIPLFIIFASAFLGLLKGLVGAVAIYFCKYTLGSESYMVPLSMAGLVGTILSALSIKFWLKFIDKRQILIWTNVIAGLMGLFAYYFIPYTNVNVIIVYTFFSQYFQAFGLILFFAMIADTIDYGEWKYGTRYEAFTYSFFTFVSKMRGALSQWLLGIMLAYYGYISGVEQVATLGGDIYKIITIYPAIGAFLAAIPMLFYPINRKLRQEIQKDLELREVS
ncbi:MFS transporter [Acidaminobacter sp. JC074]|uniref:MFS transporter n=1 Tax=Acidaminobacter sp. JC074 TaxID=2530199 RepID=UPI001F0DED05|nr:glycoside-pentoside-hexuronide (GPH):cation symporter [Acidaminobacter sp. JC074]MCH4890131.1 MFS transporter [Acidaminobacter sp. JC074]